MLGYGAHCHPLVQILLLLLVHEATNAVRILIHRQRREVIVPLVLGNLFKSLLRVQVVAFLRNQDRCQLNLIAVGTAWVLHVFLIGGLGWHSRSSVVPVVSVPLFI